MSESGHSKSSSRRRIKRNFSAASTPCSHNDDTNHNTNNNMNTNMTGQKGLDLSIVSWNISGCEPSNAAPMSSWTMEESMERIKYEILSYGNENGDGRNPSSGPHIIALQESPYKSWGAETFRRNYTSMGTTVSHCQFVDLLIRNDLLLSNTKKEKENDGDDGNVKRAVPINLNASLNENSNPNEYIPAVAAKLTLSLSDTNEEEDVTVSIASCHLAPFGSAPDKQRRYQQFKNLYSKMITDTDTDTDADATPASSFMIIAGDMNMRQAEDNKIEKTFGVIDTWKASAKGCQKSCKFTWNSHENLYHRDGFRFTCRFDRIYVKSIPLLSTSTSASTSTSTLTSSRKMSKDDKNNKNQTNMIVQIKEFGLVGNDPILEREGGGGRGHYLSDHYGLICNLGL